PDGQEVFGFQEMVDTFDWKRINTVGPVFDLDKLAWLNGHYIRELSVGEFTDRLVEYAGRTGRVLSTDETALLRGGAPLVQERVTTLREGLDMLGFLLVDEVEVDEAARAKVLTAEAKPTVAASVDALNGLSSWTTAEIEAVLRASLVEGLGLKPKNAFGPIRVAVTGRTVSPPLFESMELLGREKSLARLGKTLSSMT
ncbi:MAG: glutamyl-tRNA synthetase, partial [Frankiales bacterium]|nr:glutamyl-tRNA synthetase [Frankiales bacterium]